MRVRARRRVNEDYHAGTASTNNTGACQKSPSSECQLFALVVVRARHAQHSSCATFDARRRLCCRITRSLFLPSLIRISLPLWACRTRNLNARAGDVTRHLPRHRLILASRAARDDYRVSLFVELGVVRAVFVPKPHTFLLEYSY